MTCLQAGQRWRPNLFASQLAQDGTVNVGTSVEQKEHVYAKHLPLLREMAKNLQSFGEESPALS